MFQGSVARVQFQARSTTLIAELPFTHRCTIIFAYITLANDLLNFYYQAAFSVTYFFF